MHPVAFVTRILASKEKKYAPEDGSHGPKHVEIEKEIIKNFVASDGHYNKVLLLFILLRPKYCP
jgi:hypothetical protein